MKVPTVMKGALNGVGDIYMNWRGHDFPVWPYMFNQSIVDGLLAGAALMDGFKKNYTCQNTLFYTIVREMGMFPFCIW